MCMLLPIPKHCRRERFSRGGCKASSASVLTDWLVLVVAAGRRQGCTARRVRPARGGSMLRDTLLKLLLLPLVCAVLNRSSARRELQSLFILKVVRTIHFFTPNTGSGGLRRPWDRRDGP